jgi:purine-binding chemotaxis protein CheW
VGPSDQPEGAPGSESGSLPPTELAASGAQRRAAIADGATAEVERTFVLFELAREPYAIPLEHVVKIERVPPLIPVPRTPSFVRGIASLRGEIVCVVDLRSLLGLSGSNLAPHGLLVLQDGARHFAVLSDVLPDYFKIKTSAILPSPNARAGDGVVSEVIERQGTFIALLDTKKLFSVLGSRLDV